MKYLIKIVKQNLYLKKVKLFKSCGINLLASFSTSHFSFNTIDIGNNVFIGSNAWFSAHLSIGNNVMFGPSCKAIGGDHVFGVIGMSNRFLKPSSTSVNKGITIEDEVWCGANVIILKGVILGMGSIIGAGAVVSRSTPPFTVNIGNPSKVVKLIFSDEQLIQHLSGLGYSDVFVDEVVNRRRFMLKQLNVPVLDFYRLPSTYEYSYEIS